MIHASSRIGNPAVGCAGCQSSCFPESMIQYCFENEVGEKQKVSIDRSNQLINRIYVKAFLPPLSAFVGVSVLGYFLGLSDLLLAAIGLLSLGVGILVNKGEDDPGSFVSRMIDEDV